MLKVAVFNILVRKDRKNCDLEFKSVLLVYMMDGRARTSTRGLGRVDQLTEYKPECKL